MTDTAPLHPDDGIVRSHSFNWYVAAGVDCEPFDIRAWRQLELERLGLAKTKTTSKSAPVIVGKRRALPKAKR